MRREAGGSDLAGDCRGGSQIRSAYLSPDTEGEQISGHVACRPNAYDGHANTGCFVVCAEHDLRISFGSSHDVAVAACREHNATRHPERRRDQPRLLSVIYHSVRAAGVTEVDLAGLLLRARHTNAAVGVTGMLLAQDDQFLQALEGPEPIVRNLLESITRDRRHEHVTVLADEIVPFRRFPDWAMAEGHIGEVESHPLAEYHEALLLARGTATR